MRTYVRLSCLVSFGFFAVGLLSGCGAVAGAMIGASLSGATAGEAIGIAFGAPPLLPPEINCSTADSITVMFNSSGEDDQEDKAKQLISGHCGGGYSETQRIERPGWHAIDASCDRPLGQEEAVPPCRFDPNGPAGFGEEGQQTS